MMMIMIMMTSLSNFNPGDYGVKAAVPIDPVD